jgi:hypothetical protein
VEEVQAGNVVAAVQLVVGGLQIFHHRSERKVIEHVCFFLDRFDADAIFDRMSGLGNVEPDQFVAIGTFVAGCDDFDNRFKGFGVLPDDHGPGGWLA